MYWRSWKRSIATALLIFVLGTSGLLALDPAQQAFLFCPLQVLFSAARSRQFIGVQIVKCP
jgi:hypothetical protein